MQTISVPSVKSLKSQSSVEIKSIVAS